MKYISLSELAEFIVIAIVLFKVIKKVCYIAAPEEVTKFTTKQ